MNRLTKTYEDERFGVADNLLRERFLVDIGSYEEMEEYGRLLKLPHSLENTTKEK